MGWYPRTDCSQLLHFYCLYGSFPGRRQHATRGNIYCPCCNIKVKADEHAADTIGNYLLLRPNPVQQVTLRLSKGQLSARNCLIGSPTNSFIFDCGSIHILPNYSCFRSVIATPLTYSTTLSCLIACSFWTISAMRSELLSMVPKRVLRSLSLSL